MYNIFIENPERINDIESEIAKFRARIVSKNINSLGLSNTQIETILRSNTVYRDARSR